MSCMRSERIFGTVTVMTYTIIRDDKSDIYQVFQVDDIFIFWMDISEIRNFCFFVLTIRYLHVIPFSYMSVKHKISLVGF